MSYGSEWFNPVSRNSSTTTIVKASIEAGLAYSWNGPWCPTCRHGYIGSAHVCSVEHLQQIVDELQAKIAALNESP